MNQENINEALEQIRCGVLMGFETEEELFDSISSLFEEEDELDEQWLQQTIDEQFEQHRLASTHWQHPTDFEKLAAAFDQLIRQKIVCLHKAGYTKRDGEDDCEAVIEELREKGVQAIGYCYYHTQDLERAIDPDISNLYIGFDSATHNDDEAIAIGHAAQAALQAQGFEVNWNGTVNQRLEIAHIRWQKVPDGQDWGSERVLALLASGGNDTPGKKPFWKFW